MINRSAFSNRKLIFILGPTASGKSQLAHTISQFYSVPIISMDSMQIYSELNIGTAKPSPEDIKKHNYYGLNIVSPYENFSVGAYRRYVEKVLSETDYSVFIVCGGTGLYYLALTKGLSNLPERNGEFRKKIVEGIKKNGLQHYYEELMRVDAKYASTISQNDTQRIIRALEVYHLSGVPLSEHHEKEEDNPISSQTVKLGILIQRSILHDSIVKRVDEMLESGWEKEALIFYNNRPENYMDLAAYKAIGYSTFTKYFQGEITKDELVKKIKFDTLHYAKRQITWFKRDKNIIWIGKNNYNIVDKIVKDFILMTD